MGAGLGKRGVALVRPTCASRPRARGSGAAAGARTHRRRRRGSRLQPLQHRHDLRLKVVLHGGAAGPVLVTNREPQELRAEAGIALLLAAAMGVLALLTPLL